jgi:plasmid maintenance system antidote protein VapI
MYNNSLTDSRFLFMKKRIHIGQIIQQYLNEKGISPSWLAEKLGCSRANIYKILSKYDLNTNQVSRIAIALKHDFHSYFSKFLKENYDIE